LGIVVCNETQHSPIVNCPTSFCCDEELGQLERIVLKVGTGASGGPDGNAG